MADEAHGNGQPGSDRIRDMLESGSRSGVVLTGNDGRWRLVRYQVRNATINDVLSIEAYEGTDLVTNFVLFDSEETE